MRVIYAHQIIPKDIHPSIFLAGPTPRDNSVRSWRPEATKILRDLGFDGTILIPEAEDGVWRNNYDDQIEWEWNGLSSASCIVFWIPRDLTTMPAFTTNIEWGRWYESGKIVLGYPEGTPKMSYFKYCAERNNIPQSDNLTETLKQALAKITSLGGFLP